MKSTHVLSFAWFIDLNIKYNYKWEFEDGEDIRPFLRVIENDFKDVEFESGYIFRHDYDEDKIINILEKNKYFVINGLENYCVFAIAIDYQRFWIWSEDCKAEIIKWRDHDENDPIDNNYNSYYDASPPIDLFEKLNT